MRRTCGPSWASQIPRGPVPRSAHQGVRAQRGLGCRKDFSLFFKFNIHQSFLPTKQFKLPQPLSVTQTLKTPLTTSVHGDTSHPSEEQPTGSQLINLGWMTRDCKDSKFKNCFLVQNCFRSESRLSEIPRPTRSRAPQAWAGSEEGSPGPRWRDLGGSMPGSSQHSCSQAAE